jgi:predicted metal-dependent hydrolase
MSTRLHVGDIVVDVELKGIKNVHLSVHPPTGRVHISAPARMSVETIRLFAISRLEWIRQQQAVLRDQERETPREYLDRESHYVWGTRRVLRIVKSTGRPSVEVNHDHLVLAVRPGTAPAIREATVAQWYRHQLKAVVPNLIVDWESRLHVHVKRFYVQQMKTKWGSCNTAAHTIRLNTELAKKPKDCLEYVIVHELVHLLEPTHNSRFVALMNQFMPQWQHTRQMLNRLPVRHVNWDY